MITLYELQGIYSGFLHQVSGLENPEQEQELVEKYFAAEEDRNLKLANCCAYYKNLDAEVTAYTEEIDRLEKRKLELQNKVERFKQYMSRCLDGETYKDGVHQISWRKSERVNISDETQVPACYIREKVIREVDKLEAKKDLKLGVIIPGLELEEKNNIQIK